MRTKLHMITGVAALLLASAGAKANKVSQQP
jgi:hypothetical protein